MTKAKVEALKRAKGREVVRFGEGGEPFANVGGYLGQQGMFAPQVALILDRALESAEGKELIIEQAETLIDADALVIDIETKVDAITKKKLAKGIKIEVFGGEEATADEPLPPNVFALTDAFAAGDRKGAWVTYRTLINAGAQPEEIHGALGWAVRGMVLAGKTKSATEAGMKDYPYKKAKGAVARIGLPQAEQLSRDLVALIHDSRKGQGDLEDLLEVFLLKK